MEASSNYSGKIVKSPIISCSRRTDIPSFLMGWVIDRMRTGYVDVSNPFNRRNITRVSLKPEDVKCWVWWSKNFEDWIKTYKQNISLFKSYKGHVFHFTVNSPSELEPAIKISLEERFLQLEWLVRNFTPSAVNLRFDPIVFYKKPGTEQVKNNLDRFECIVDKASSLGLRELIFSFVTLYNKTEVRMLSRGKIPIYLTADEKRDITRQLQRICSRYDILMKACCQPELLSIPGIIQAHCIDAYQIERVTGEAIPKLKDPGQRKGCACYKSKDIGGYRGSFSCKNSCDYCYASPIKNASPQQTHL